MLFSSSWRTVILQLLLLSASIDASTTTTAATSSISSDPYSSRGLEETTPTSSITATTTTAPAPAPASPVVNSTATCQSVSVNYISPGLPEQCLRTRSTVSQDTRHSQDEATASHTVTEQTRLTGSTSTTASADIPEGTRGSSESSSSVSTPPTVASKAGPPPPPPKTAEEPPLDTAKFLSFEEWKAQNLAKIGQSSDSFSERGAREPLQKMHGLGNTALDALGDEIEIDFPFGTSGSPANTIQVSGSAAAGIATAAAGMPRSKDAGKTCKERFNYASLDCAATVHKYNKEVKGGNSILLENKESYMLNKCQAKEKFFIVELCEDILVDTVVLANFEFFSSVFKEIKVSVSDKYPVKANGWKELGTYVAKNTRDVQAFLVETPLIWARYIKVEILSHYGNEYYCPVSLLRVHGTTMMEEFRHESAARGGEDDVREDVVPEAVAEPVKSADAEEEAGTVMESTSSHEETATGVVSQSGNSDIPLEAPKSSVSEVTEVNRTPSSSITTSYEPWQSTNRRYLFPMEMPSCPKTVKPRPTKVSIHHPPPPQAPWSAGSDPSETPVSKQISVPAFSATVVLSIPPSPSAASAKQETGNSIRSVASKGQEGSKPSSPQPPTASPTTQESFFKSVHKRLTHLESNSTLSLQYIEEQSRLMRDTFANMEKSHVSKMERLLEAVNSSAFTDLKTYRDKYDQLWQSTVLALEAHRSHSEREMLAISTRLSFLADEVIFQKRMYQLNTLLLVITIGVVIFSRNDRLAMPLGRHLRTHSTIRIFESPPTSPQPENPIISMKRNNSDDSIDNLGSPISPPTSREQSPVVGTESASAGSPPAPKYKGERRGWIHHFGPKLKAENSNSRGRRWQRQPSPLAGDGEPGEPVYNDGGYYEGETASEASFDENGKVESPLLNGS
ncbi:UNC-like C-terminal-domain-containing protein [Trichophaea hybrida]|nr:UNC-like C-terminal-domain-containing protein [Trichophaea hybrida]